MISRPKSPHVSGRRPLSPCPLPIAPPRVSANPLNLTHSPSRSSFNAFSPEITARFRPSANLTLYAAYREGFTSGGFNMAPGASPPPVSNNVSFDQAHAKGFEVG